MVVALNPENMLTLVSNFSRPNILGIEQNKIYNTSPHRLNTDESNVSEG